MGEAKKRRERAKISLGNLPIEMATLHAGEERLRLDSIKLISKSDELQFHLKTVKESMDLLNTYFYKYHSDNPEEITVQYLSIRCFNCAASCLKLSFSGYGQAASAMLRDLLETAFLVSMFNADKSLITQWRNVPEDQRGSKFGPRVVREYLDRRNGFDSRKRKEAYDVLCRLGAHPTMQGFALLNGENGLAPPGPFVSEQIITPVIEELARIMVQVGGAFDPFLPVTTKELTAAKIQWLIASDAWFLKHYGNEPGKDLIALLKAAL